MCLVSAGRLPAFRVVSNVTARIHFGLNSDVCSNTLRRAELKVTKFKEGNRASASPCHVCREPVATAMPPPPPYASTAIGVDTTAVLPPNASPEAETCCFGPSQLRNEPLNLREKMRTCARIFDDMIPKKRPLVGQERFFLALCARSRRSLHRPTSYRPLSVKIFVAHAPPLARLVSKPRGNACFERVA